MENTNYQYMQEGNLVPLVTGATYLAQLRGIRSNKGHDPIVQIFNPNCEGYYFGHVRRSTSPNLEQRVKSNEIRSGLKASGQSGGMINVIVIAPPKRGSAKGPYKVVSTDKKPRIPSEFDITVEEAFSVLKGNRTYWARCISVGSHGTPFLKTYEADGTPISGFITRVEKDELAEASTYAEQHISMELMQSLKLGDFVLVRKTQRNHPFLFEPVINFTRTDDAISPNGHRLVTRVAGYKHGDRILDLPILFLREGTRPGDVPAGMGYVEQPLYDPQKFYYKQVIVRGAEGDVGKYVREARILANATVILAEKVR